MTNRNKLPLPLNLPKDKKVQFDDVSFVHKLDTEYKLKVFIKRIWQQLMAFTNIVETKHNDIPKIMDKMMSGVRWNKNDFEDRYQYGFFKEFVIQYDTLKRTFVLLDSVTREPLTKPVKATSVSEGKKHAKRIRNN